MPLYTLTVRVEGMNDCPPKPGLTDISRMMSTLSITYLQGIEEEGDVGMRESLIRKSD